MNEPQTLSRRAAVQSAGRFALGAALAGQLELFGRVGDALAASAPGDVRHFLSRPDLRPPRLTVVRRASPASGELFLAPSSGPGQRGVLIADSTGEPVYFHPTTPNTAMNFRAATYHGRPVLTWWEGKATHGLGTGTHVILDDTYRVVARVPAAHGRQSDLHEFLITPDNTALLTSYELRTTDLTAVGGPQSARVIGGVVQEIALPSGRLLFEWRSLDHVAIDETHVRYEGHPLDYFHVNSIDLAPNGDLLVSARNTWAVYRISRKTGRVIWRLGGRRSDFTMGRGTVFAWQHDARHHGSNRLTIFDDGAQPQVEPQSRALMIELDYDRRAARLIRKYTHRPGRIVTRYMGNVQVLADGHVLVGWGSEPWLTEFAPDGKIELDMRLPHGGQSYRVLRFPWHGRPYLPPAAVYRYAGGRRTVYASWNGATEVAAWRLDTGVRQVELQHGDPVPRAGFETALPVTTPGHTWARAVALHASGEVLGRSRLVRI